MQQMERSNEILAELLESAPYLVKQDQTRIPYSIPEGYFDSFPEILMFRIRLEASINKEILKDVPEISSRQEIADISGLLAGLRDKNPYWVPKDYFDSLNFKIPAFG